MIEGIWATSAVVKDSATDAHAVTRPTWVFAIQLIVNRAAEGSAFAYPGKTHR